MACPASDRRLWSDPDSGSANRPNQCKNLLTMGKRGRRPHPDILTPREWEVLDLLRERLTNEQIAERLGITLDGAKYHVSEILSKLGVATREEAAAWRAARAAVAAADFAAGGRQDRGNSDTGCSSGGTRRFGVGCRRN